jgi:hypothetical protein
MSAIAKHTANGANATNLVAALVRAEGRPATHIRALSTCWRANMLRAIWPMPFTTSASSTVVTLASQIMPRIAPRMMTRAAG